MKISQNVLNAQVEEQFRKTWDLPDNWKNIEKHLIKWEDSKKTRILKMDNTEEIRGLMDYEADDRTIGEKVPDGLVLSKEQLLGLKYKKSLKDFGDGKGPKPRYTLFIGDKTYYAPPIVMNLLRTAASDPHVLRIRLKIQGIGLATRYDLEKVLDKEAF